MVGAGEGSATALREGGAAGSGVQGGAGRYPSGRGRVQDLRA